MWHDEAARRASARAVTAPGGLAAALAIAVLACAAGCGAAPERVVETRLGREAKLTLQPAKGRSLELVRDGAGLVVLPVPTGGVGPFTERIRLTEPNKPPLTCEVLVYVDPGAAEEDAIHFTSAANVQVLRTDDHGVTGTYEGVYRAYAEPLELLRDALGGPWFPPERGRGVVVALDPSCLRGLGAGDPSASALRAPVRVTVSRPDGSAAREALIATAPVRLREGVHAADPQVFLVSAERASVRVERPGYRTYEAEVDVPARAFALLVVRLAEDRPQ